MELDIILKNFLEIKEIKPNYFQVKTNAVFMGNITLYSVVEKKDNIYRISDNKQILPFMNNYYELRAPDIRNCIRSVLKVNKMQIKEGEIFCEFEEESKIPQRLTDFLLCAGQLIRMFAFFDPPEKK